MALLLSSVLLVGGLGAAIGAGAMLFSGNNPIRMLAGVALAVWLACALAAWLVPMAADPLVSRGMMGDGVADLQAIRAAVEGAGYDGLCEVEIFSAGHWWKRDPDEVLDVMVERLRTVC